MLEHLVIHPRGGLCNRLRAIASAKRLCAKTGARGTIVWDWGDYQALFDDDTEWIPYTEQMDWQQNVIIPGYHHIRHIHPQDGGTSENRRVPVTTHPHIAVISWYVFCAAEEPLLKGSEEGVFPWFPKPHPSILEKVSAFTEARFSSHTAGVHIRRTDHKRAILRSPDEAYFKEGDRLVDKGYHLFLATDNEETRRMMQQRYGRNLIHYPKASQMKQRWPRETSTTEDVIDDMVDLWLLAACEFIIGSATSSYSRVAILLNGSPCCKALDRPFLKWRSWIDQIWRRHRPWNSSVGHATNSVKKMFGLSPGAIEAVQACSQRGDPDLQPALEWLLTEADQALQVKPVSVMDKPQAPASGDRHDYLSFAPYFWPDPAKEDGLPYVRRDGRPNPESDSERSDKPRLKKMAPMTKTLALAYRLTGNEQYAAQAALQLRTWFLDPETRMTPHLNYAQVIPGLTAGRSFGVLDGHYLLSALDAAGMLAGSFHWRDADQDSLMTWVMDFLNWLRTSKNGKKEAGSKNNHGTLYDVQVTHTALFVGDIVLARRTAKRAKRRRIAAQIQPDGSQPHELKRSEAFQYSQYNLEALFKLATRAEHAGVNLWHYQTAKGAGIRKALDFLMPYLEEPAKRWPYPGIQSEPEFDTVLRQASRIYGDERYLHVLRKEPGLTVAYFLDLIR